MSREAGEGRLLNGRLETGFESLCGGLEIGKIFLISKYIFRMQDLLFFISAGIFSLAKLTSAPLPQA